jgi:subtilisin family serine protease
MRLLRRPEVRILALAAIGVAAWLTVRHSQGPAAPPERAQSPSWIGLVNPARPAVDTAGRVIVVLRTPSVAEHVAAAKLATEQAERRWTAEAYAAQQQVLIQLARHGFSVRPDYRYARVLDGFSAHLDPRAIGLLERNPEVAGVYPVRIAYPAAISATARAGVAPRVGLPRFNGTGLSIALLDTGVDLTHPYLAGRVEPGFDLVGGAATAEARSNPQNRKQFERHGTALAGILVGAGGPHGLRGVAPGASVVPMRIAGWQETANGRDAVFARSDQLIAGLDRAVDPNGDGDAHDALRIALLGVAEPFASFGDSPEAESVSGALTLDTLVVAPAGNDGAAGPLFGSIAGPGGSPSAFVVGATDSRPSISSVRVVFHQGIVVLADTKLPLLGAAVPGRHLRLALAAPGASGSLEGKAVLVAAGKDPAAAVRAGAAEGAAAVLVYGHALPPGSLTGASVPVVGVPEGTAASMLAAVRRHFLVEVALGRAATAGNPDAGRVASFSSHGLTFTGRLAPQVSAPGVGIETSYPGSPGDGAPAYASVTGTSVAAATAAGAAALLAQARPGLSAADLASLLAGSARPSGASPAAGGTGTVDPGASAAGEVAASETSLSFGPWNGPRWHQVRTIEVRDVSSRRLTVSVVPSSRLLSVKPAMLDLRPGQSALVRVTAQAAKRPALAVVTGALALRPVGGRVLRIPWVIAFRPYTGPLLGRAAVSPASFSPSDSNPAALTVVAGRISTGRALQIEPVGRLDVLLYSSAGAFLGVLATVPDLLPGTYRFALTGRGPGGAVLPPGRYEIRLVAHPTLGVAPTRRKIPIRIE